MTGDVTDARNQVAIVVQNTITKQEVARKEGPGRQCNLTFMVTEDMCDVKIANMGPGSGRYTLTHNGKSNY